MKPSTKCIQFHSLNEEILFKIQYTSDWLAFRQMKLLEKFHLSPEQYYVLKGIRENPEQTLSPREIQKYTKHRGSDVSRMLLRLEKKELIQKKVSTLDKRSTDINLTPEAVSLLEQIDPVMESWLSNFSALTLVDKRSFHILLNKIIK